MVKFHHLCKLTLSTDMYVTLCIICIHFAKLTLVITDASHLRYTAHTNEHNDGVLPWLMHYSRICLPRMAPFSIECNQLIHP